VLGLLAVVSEWCRHLGSPDRRNLIISAKYQIRSAAHSSPCSCTRLPRDPNTGVVYSQSFQGRYTQLTMTTRTRVLLERSESIPQSPSNDDGETQYEVKPHSPQLASPVWRIVSTSFIRRSGEQSA